MKQYSQAVIVALALAALGGVSIHASAQQPAPPSTAAGAPAPATAPGAQPPASSAPAVSKDAKAAPDAPRKPASAEGSPQHFEPTEKVRPDFDVAFPVDI